MLTWSDLQDRYTNWTNDSSTANLTLGKSLMHMGYKKYVQRLNLDFGEIVLPITLINGTYNYPLSPKYGKAKAAQFVETGGQEIPLIEVQGVDQWNRLRYGQH